MKTIYNQSFSDTKADAGIVQSIQFTQIAYDLRLCWFFTYQLLPQGGTIHITSDYKT